MKINLYKKSEHVVFLAKVRKRPKLVLFGNKYT